MSEQYYKKTESIYGITFAPVDICWRWCNDELPDDEQEVITDLGAMCYLIADDIWIYLQTRKTAEPSQWCKPPEPLKEVIVE